MDKPEKKTNRRDFLFTASYTVGAVGLGAVVWPLIDQMNPDRAQQAPPNFQGFLRFWFVNSHRYELTN